MRAQLREALTSAMKARDPVAVSALRSALAAIGNAEAVDAAQVPQAREGDAEFAGAVVGLGAGEAQRRSLTDADIEQIVRTEVAERLAAAGAYEETGHRVPAERLRAEAEVLRGHLPG